MEGELSEFGRRIRAAVSSTLYAAATDRELLARFADMRDETAFAVLVGRYGRLVLNTCRHVLGDEHDAEEATQGTFLVLARRANSLRDREVLAGWLHGVGYRISLRARRDANRRRARESRKRPAAAVPPPAPADEVAWRETRAILDEELQRLPERLRTPFVLCCQEGLTHAEAARRLGWKTGTVSSRLHEARKRLRLRLERRGVTLSALPGGLTLADGMTRATLPAARVSNTVAAALRFVKGEAAGPAAKLAKDALRGALWARVRAVAIGAAVAGALVMVPSAYFSAPRATPDEREPTALAPPLSATANLPRPDRLGDALPDDAISRPDPNRIGHDFYAESTVWSPDGKVIASLGGGGDGRPLCLWDVSTDRKLHQLAARDAVRSAAFSPDGKTLAAAESKRGIVLWDVGSGKELGRVPCQGDAAAVAFAPDGRTLAAAGRTGVIQIREVASGRLVVELKASANQPVKSVTFAPDGKTLASAGEDAAVVLWDLSTGTERWRKKPHGDRADGVVFAPDGKTFATTGADNVIRVWNTSSGASLTAWQQALPIGPAKNATPNGTLIAFSPDGRTLASGLPGNCVRLWDPATGKGKGQWPTGSVQSLSFAPNGRALATTAPGGNRVRLWDPEMRTLVPATLGHNPLIHGLWFSPDGKTVWSAARYKGVFRCDVARGKGQQLPGARSDDYFQPTDISRDGRTVATGRRDGSIGLSDTDGHPLATLTGHIGAVLSVAFAPDGKVLGSSGADHTVRIWDVVTNRELARAPTPDRTWGCLAFSPDGRKLALARGGEASRLPVAPLVMEVRTCTEVFRLEFPSAEPFTAETATASEGPKEFVTFSPDGRTLATSGKYRDSVARLWNAATGEFIGRCGSGKSSSPGSCLSFSPDGRLLATGPDFGSNLVSLWELATRQQAASMLSHEGGTTALAFSPDGRSLASGSSDGAVRIFDLTGPGRCNDASLELDWDLTGRTDSELRRASWLPGLKLEDYWELLRGENAKAAYRSVRALAADPTHSVPFLAARLRPTEPPDSAAAARLATDVNFEREWLRQRRAVMALEYSATPEARALLRTLATGEVVTPLAGEARAAVDRLNSPR